ncbi:Apa1p [Sugiyamaella lignohabitans]|uniref:Apa1p n=1 Tax=Sugiyamaella lignohabitans TaxID=796027 RepID=A0A167E2M0_9ASCO|nr:Apa1p [Sugiyamaella lignohabitans]ANB13568.1 Apa1p [Sugiyamaella lignohabitans]
MSLPSDFYQQLDRKFDEAVADGSLVYTKSETVPDCVDGLHVRYTLATALAKRPSTSSDAKLAEPEHESSASGVKSPWLPPDASLLVVPSFGAKGYRVVLNKFAVQKNHFLLVTKSFERQTSPLTEDDLLAAFELLVAANKQSKRRHVGFFNSGYNSGASVAHKHIQFLPLPDSAFEPFPDHVIEKMTNGDIPIYRNGDAPLKEDKYHFSHFIVPTPKDLTSGDELALRYSAIMARVMTTLAKNKAEYISYNFLFTEKWMMAVPRRAEKIQGKSINALGCIGLFLAKTNEDLLYFKQVGPELILQTVGFNAEDIDGNELEGDIGYTRY